ncbi:MAG TPA: hypothetical protein VGD58_34040 [Herpetosiphonaceae bacterium]
MLHTVVVALHVIGAIGALITGSLAFVFPNGTRTHRMLGKLYLVMWATLAICGFIIGWGRPGISIFEAATVLGVYNTVYAYAMVLFRRRIGRTWLKRHYGGMLGSMAALVVATVNQILPRLGLEYPIWVFVLMMLSPFVIIPLFQRRLDRRYGFANVPAPRKEPVEQAA